MIASAYIFAVFLIAQGLWGDANHISPLRFLFINVVEILIYLCGLTLVALSD